MDRGALSDEVTFEPRPQWSDRVNQELLQITGKTASTKTPSGVSRGVCEELQEASAQRRPEPERTGGEERSGLGNGMGAELWREHARPCRPLRLFWVSFQVRSGAWRVLCRGVT